MGKDLHPSILPFILSRIEEHQNVVSIVDLSTDSHYIFRIQRSKGMRDVIVVISDSYYFSEFDYHSKPVVLNEGGFILIARPESTFSSETQHHINADKVIVGKIGVLLGALREDEFWAYEKPKPQNRK